MHALPQLIPHAGAWTGSRKQAASRASCAGDAAQPELLLLLPDVQMCKKLLQVGKEKSLASDSTPNVGSGDRDSSLFEHKSASAPLSTKTTAYLVHLLGKIKDLACKAYVPKIIWRV